MNGDLTPAPFPEANVVLKAPPGMDDCGDLHVFRDGTTCTSAWTAPLRTRLAFLIGGRLWLHVWSGATQPPVALTVSRRGPFEVGEVGEP
ncbi:MAG: hypothetical protein ABI780_01880 [Ardenticatenales bacterium]